MVHVVTVISSIFILAKVWIPGGSSIWRFCVIVSFRGLDGIAFVHWVAWAAQMCQRGCAPSWTLPLVPSPVFPTGDKIDNDRYNDSHYHY